MRRLTLKPVRFLLLCLSLAAAAEAVGLASRAPEGELAARSDPNAPAALLSVDPSSREASLNFYRSQYLMVSPPGISWTGSRETCDPGTTAPEFRAKVIQRINYFRAMAGVPPVVEDPRYSAKAQAAALITATSTLTHYPSPSARCYSEDGAEAAAKSNLSGSRMGWSAVTGYMADDTNGAVGHRRWLLYPQTEEMGTGDVPTSGSSGANALYVIDQNFGGTRPPTREPYVAWPPPGYVPFPLVFARWSFSYPRAAFTSASVIMSRNGVSIPVTLSAAVTGYGEPTLVWIPADAALETTPGSDLVYNVSIRDVLVGGKPTNFDYQVTVFDPGQQTIPDVQRTRTPDDGELRSRYRSRMRR